MPELADVTIFATVAIEAEVEMTATNEEERDAQLRAVAAKKLGASEGDIVEVALG